MPLARRWALVVSVTDANVRLAVASVVPITGQHGQTPYEVTLPRVPWLREQSYVNAQSVQPVKWVEFQRKAGQFDAAVLKSVRSALAVESNGYQHPGEDIFGLINALGYSLNVRSVAVAQEMFNANFLFASLIWGSIGLGYFIYGKKQGPWVPGLGGLLMIVTSYFASSALVMSLISIGIIAAVYFLLKRGY